MISIKKLRENTDLFQKGLRSKGDSTDLNLIIALDEKLRSLKTKSSAMRAERNSASESIGVAKKSGEDASLAISKTRELGDKLKKLEEDLQKLEKQLNEILLQLPNLPHQSVPIGSSENDNVESKWGKA